MILTYGITKAASTYGLAESDPPFLENSSLYGWHLDGMAYPGYLKGAGAEPVLPLETHDPRPPTPPRSPPGGPMSRPRKAPSAAPAPRQPPSPAEDASAARRATLTAAIAARWGVDHEPIQTQMESVSRLTERDLRLPAYQRGAVWDFDRAVAFLDAFLRGVVAQSMVFIDRYDPAARTHYTEVIDGQQRCLAFGLTLTDAAGAPRSGVTPLLSLTDLQWHAEPAPDRWSLADLCGDRFYTMIDSGAAREQSLAGSIINRRANRYWWSVVTIPRRTPPAKVRDFFRTWNAPGAPFSPTDLEALLAAHPDPEPTP